MSATASTRWRWRWPGGSGGLARVAARSLGWGTAMAGVRLACSFASIKVTAVVLGPGGLALVAQLAGLVTLLQSLLGQGLVTGLVRLQAERPDDATHHRRVASTAAWMALGLAGLAAVGLAALGPRMQQDLLAGRGHPELLIAAALAVALAIGSDLLRGALGVSREVGLIGRATIAATVGGLALFVPAAWSFGLDGALWATLAASGVAAASSAAVVAWRSRKVSLRDFIGRPDAAIARRLSGFFPMLAVNAVLPPLALILARDALAAHHGLEAAGLWQAAWRLSEAYQSVIVASVALYLMPSLSEVAADRQRTRRRLLLTLAAATAATASLGVAVVLLREPIVRAVFTADFAVVAGYLPLQCAGDVLRIAGWILSMGLVADLRSGRFIAVTSACWATFVALSLGLVPDHGAQGVLWAHVAAGAVQCALAALALRDLLWPAAGRP